MKLLSYVLENDRGRSTLTYHLTDYEEQVSEADMNHRCEEKRQIARDCRSRYDRESCSDDKTLVPVMDGLGSNKPSWLVLSREKAENSLNYCCAITV